MEWRTYGQFCGVAHALDLVGERWSILVLRELVLGPKRFTDLANGLPGIGTNILSARLKHLEEAGVVGRRTLPPPAASAVYELTDYGRELVPTLLALGRWGVKSMGPRRAEQTLRSNWLAVALQAFVHAEAAAGVRETYELHLGDSAFHARVADGQVQVLDGPAEVADLVLHTDDETLIALLTGAVEPAEAVASGAIRMSGDERALARFREIFRFPEPSQVA